MSQSFGPATPATSPDDMITPASGTKLELVGSMLDPPEKKPAHVSPPVRVALRMTAPFKDWSLRGRSLPKQKRYTKKNYVLLAVNE